MSTLLKKAQEEFEKKYPVKVQALKTNDEKKQHLEPGKVYRVTEATANAMFKNGQARKANANHEVGKSYDLPKAKADLVE